MNGNYDFSEVELKTPLVKSEVKNWSLDYVIEQMLLGCYDFEPPYQRGKVWSKSYNVELLRSILDSTPIGAVHLVKKNSDPSSPYMWVLDAKQRLSSIEMFVQRGSKLKLRVLDNDGSIKEVSWKEMSENANSKWRFIYNKIKTYQITVVIWENCNFETQGIIFDRVNNSVPLNSWERMYGNHFVVKNLLQYINNNYFLNRKFLNKQQAEDRRNSGIQLVHSILCLCFGYEFNDVFACRQLASKNLKDSCERLQKSLISQEINATTQFDDKIIEKLGLTTNLKNLKTASDWFSRSANYKNNLKNKFEAGFILDTITFLVKKIEQKVLTTSIVEQNFDKMHNFITEWFDYKNAASTLEEKQRRQAIKSRSTQASSIKTRHEAMEFIFSKIELNLCAKGNKVSAKDKTLALLVAEPTDPINGLALSDDNVEIDHVISCKLSDTTTYSALTDVSNRRKSDQDLNTLEKTEHYIANQSAL